MFGSRYLESDSSIKASLEAPKSKYLVGWSHGKETLRPGLIDTFKGSYYINCSFYQQNQQQTFDPNFPEYTAPNIWPSETSIPTFRSSLEELITLIIDVAVLVARACDRYASETIEGYQPGYLERVVKTSMTTKARLLHYFPEEGTQSSKNANGTTRPETKFVEEDDESPSYDDTWCATHKDHGCLTGLTSAMFVDESSTSPASTDITELPKSPSPSSGLYIHSRAGTTTKINIPRDALAFQTGETLELITRGKFRAVPHYVRGVGGEDVGGRRIARNPLAVFTQPNLDEIVDSERGWTFGEFARGVVGRNTTDGVEK